MKHTPNRYGWTASKTRPQRLSGNQEAESLLKGAGTMIGLGKPNPIYRVNLNLIRKVLDFIQFGGPDLTVGSTVFEIWMGL